MGNRVEALQIVQVLDPSHRNWVLGGIFSDLRMVDSAFKQNPIYLPSPFSLLGFFRWVSGKCQLTRHNVILFSSLTPLVNFTKVNFMSKRKLLALWFTHKEDEFSKEEIRAIQRCSIVFVHSRLAKQSLMELFPSCKFVVVIGAIDTSRFEVPAIPGDTIAWVGTPNIRKNPQLIVRLALEFPELKFRLIGKGWGESEYWKDIEHLQNLEYREVDKALSSADFDWCDKYLMLSKIEGGPMPLLESLAAGLVPICTRTGFVEDILIPLGLQDQIVDAFDLTEISKKLAQRSENLGSRPARIEFAKQFDFHKLSELIVTSIKNH